ncbi:hypothetical protein POSPLADRAFT_1178127 [Postia placenta MAD-698-R-SB12]|uniref:Uncharacterized protein n=1 Tax=Postia placenta MAD-698-R-SB12 TaxID=670580 RepID=A0A1X6NEA2_9APHY|nr:hypothetical protein POSPLADRAFT_1178127 [Postia placenta MAD-698-R-SB12]OSX66703.1 hypothetical protein POSPLADRAFT_1178127 [Postia placenta MAD-698-R-SB12]
MEFPTSYTRHPNPLVRDPPPPPQMPAHGQSSTRPSRLPTHERSVQDRRMNADHPLVAKYIDGLECAYNTEMAKCKGPFNHRLPQPRRVSQLGRIEEVNRLVAAGRTLEPLECECILALAALKLFYKQLHPAHFALWGRSVEARTVAQIHKMLAQKPQMIDPPMYWMGKTEMLWHLHRHQGWTFPRVKNSNEAGSSKNTREKRKCTANAVCAAPVANDDVPQRNRPRVVRVAEAGSSPRVAPSIVYDTPVAPHASTSAPETNRYNGHVMTPSMEKSRALPTRRSTRQANKRNALATVPGSATAAPQTADVVLTRPTDTVLPRPTRESNSAVVAAPTDKNEMHMVTRSGKRKASGIEKENGPIEGTAHPSKRRRRT